MFSAELGRRLWAVGRKELAFLMVKDAEGKPLHETQVTVCFTEVDGKTRQTFRQAGFESAASRDSHEAGWNECFDKEDAYLSQLTRSA